MCKRVEMTNTPLSVETFWEQYAGQPYELVYGKLIPLRPSGGKSSEVAVAAAAELYNYARKARNGGHVTGADGAYALSSNCLRVPDVGFYGSAKAAKITDPQKYLPFPPDLAVEVVAQNENASELLDKVIQYLEAGTALVWLIYPELKSVVVHFPNFTAKIYTPEGVLSGGDLLPGLQVAVSDLFPIADITL